MIRVIIVAPAMAVRAGLRAILSDDASVQILAEGASLNEVSDVYKDTDVVIWSPASGPETVRSEISHFRLAESAAWLIIHNDPRLMEALTGLAVSAWGVIDPEATQAELLAGVHALNEGLAVLEPLWLKQALMNHTGWTDKNHELVEPLTERESEILQLLANGLTNKQIAARLKISAHTVKFHVSSIFNKMGTTNRVETVNLGLKMGLIVL